MQGARGSHATPNGAPAPVESGAQAGRKTLTNSSEQLLKPLDLILHPPPNPSADAIIGELTAALSAVMPVRWAHSVTLTLHMILRAARMSQCTTRVGVTTRDLGTGDGGPNRGTASTPQTLPAGRAANVGDHQAATAATRGPNAAQGERS